MSGTSADGVDVAIVEVARGNRSDSGSSGTSSSEHGADMTARLLLHHHRAYPTQLREQIFAFRRPDGAVATPAAFLRQLATMGREISLTCAAAVNEALAAANLSSAELCAVAAHGQTLFHEPPDTVQWFDPALVAAEVGCAVVSDFRRADLAAGGQGAPLVPFADYLLFRDAGKNRVLLNLGGIANITWLPAGGSPRDVIGFDTGPANCVIDHLARQHGVAGGLDRDGAMSMRGRADFPTAFAAIRGSSFVFRPPPKSADIPEMIAMYERTRDQLGHAAMPLPDQMATASMMAALGVELALAHLPRRPDEIIASGGGVENSRLMQEIAAATKLPVHRTDAFGVPAQAKEAIAFALLGAATLDAIPSNIPSVTGARRPVVLGSVTPRP